MLTWRATSSLASRESIERVLERFRDVCDDNDWAVVGDVGEDESEDGEEVAGHPPLVIWVRGEDVGR